MFLLEELGRLVLTLANDDCEHGDAISIDMLNNPGWIVKADLRGTKYHAFTTARQAASVSEEDWYEYGFADGIYIGMGDPMKLELLIRELINALP